MRVHGRLTRAGLGVGLGLAVVALAIGVAPVLAAPSRVTVTMEPGNRFSPTTVTVRVGGRVTWRNDDQVLHNAVAVDSSFDTGFLAAGDSATVRFDQAGRFRYVCNIHAGMGGTVRVVAAASATEAPRAPDTNAEAPARPGEPAPVPAWAPFVAGLAGIVGGAAALRRTRRRAP